MIDGLYVPVRPAIIIPKPKDLIRPGEPRFVVPAMIGGLGVTALCGGGGATIGWQSYNNAAGATATLNPSDKNARITLSGGNLTAQHDNTSNHSLVRATHSIAVDKWAYWEVTLASVNTNIVNVCGIQDATPTTADGNFLTVSGLAAGNGYASNGNSLYALGFSTSGSAANLANGVWAYAYKRPTGELWVRSPSGWLSGSPITGTSPSFTRIAADAAVFAGCSMHGAGGGAMTYTYNFGASAFTYGLP